MTVNPKRVLPLAGHRPVLYRSELVSELLFRKRSVSKFKESCRLAMRHLWFRIAFSMFSVGNGMILVSYVLDSSDLETSWSKFISISECLNVVSARFALPCLSSSPHGSII